MLFAVYCVSDEHQSKKDKRNFTYRRCITSKRIGWEVSADSSRTRRSGGTIRLSRSIGMAIIIYGLNRSLEMSVCQLMLHLYYQLCLRCAGRHRDLYLK